VVAIDSRWSAQMRVAVTGATGLIGRAVIRPFETCGDEALALSRDPRRGGRCSAGGSSIGSWKCA
jgi:uncharacterized protein YbjT (DUF2867 family)